MSIHRSTKPELSFSQSNTRTALCYRVDKWEVEKSSVGLIRRQGLEGCRESVDELAHGRTTFVPERGPARQRNKISDDLGLGLGPVLLKQQQVARTDGRTRMSACVFTVCVVGALESPPTAPRVALQQFTLITFATCATVSCGRSARRCRFATLQDPERLGQSLPEPRPASNSVAEPCPRVRVSCRELATDTHEPCHSTALLSSVDGSASLHILSRKGHLGQ